MRTRQPTIPGNRLGMPVEAWPLVDQQAWRIAFALGESVLDGGGSGFLLRPATRLVTETSYARWLLWVKQNEPSLLNQPPGDRATRDRLSAYVRDLQTAVKARTVYGYLSHLRRALALISPEQDWSYFRPLLKNLERLARLDHRPRQNFIPSDQLFRFGIELMQQAEAADGMPAVLQAELYRDGLAIAFLALRPLRLGNMLALEIGTHFLEANGRYRVFLPAEITKTSADLEFPMPTVLTSWIARYIDHHRKILLGGPFGPKTGFVEHLDHLWLARSGQQFPVASFEGMISKRTVERFAIRLTPHGFRHCAATSIAENNPEDFHIIRIILGHATIRTAEQHYVHAKAQHAMRLVQDNLLKTRKAMAKASKPPKRQRPSISDLSSDTLPSRPTAKARSS